MTVTYTHEVANSRLCGFSNLLLRWRGSVYKLFYKEFAIYITLYSILSVCYRHIAIPEFKEYFEKLCLQFQSYTDLVPISFVLGFYVSMVVGRWWQMFLYIPWPDRLMVIVTSNVHGSDNRGRLIRRTLMRYLSLAEVLTYRSISTAVFKRFPTMQHVIDAGFMTTSEYKQYQNVKTENAKYFLPCVWFSNLLSKVRQEGRIYDDMTYQSILKELNKFRGSCGMLFSYDWISIPLVYTQVVTVAVYAFFMSTLLSRQYLDITKEYRGHEVDLYVPIFTICQFFFYVGWLKVAEQLINPFGEDDDDFEVNFIIDRNLEISMFAVDNLYLSHPKLERDIYWNNPNPSIPYTAAAANHKLEAFLGSTIDMSLHRDEMQFIESVQQPAESHGDHKLDINQNYTWSERKTASRLQPPPYSSTKEDPPRGPNPVNLWRRFTGRDKDIELRRSLLQKGIQSGRAASGSKHNVLQEQDDDEEKNMLTPGPDDDSGDSDVGDGGGSEDYESDDNTALRRSSISSLEGDGHDVEDNRRKSSIVRKHSIAEPDDRPKAKKPKNLLIKTPSDPPQEKLKMKSSDKPKKMDELHPRVIESASKSMPGRVSMGKTKKSPKKKSNVPRVNKRLDFQRKGEETEEERKNAQTRTIGLLKATKKKSVLALQRNARRKNYSGNPWLRHNYPLPWRSDIMNARDYASMTSGNEDAAKTEHDSPFGSLISFATSVPSPRPLRFSHFGKRGRRKHFDSVSISSCLTSPCGNEDFSPSTGFLETSPKDHNPSNPVSMPFTEELRRRLLVVNNTNTPSSSNANSPVLPRAFPGHFNFSYGPTMFQSATAGGQDLEDILVVSSTARPASGTAWENTLEAIGEAAASTDKSSIKLERSEKIPQSKPEAVAQSVRKRYDVDQKESPANSEKQVGPLISIHSHNASSHRLLSRSSSCPDVPKFVFCDAPTLSVHSPKKNGDFSACSQNTLQSQLTKSKANANNLISEECSSPSKSQQIFRHEQGVAQPIPGFNKDSEITEEDTASSATDLTQYCSSELTPLLYQEDTCEDEMSKTQKIVGSGNTTFGGEETDSQDKPNNSSRINGIRNSVYDESALGYCSMKEGENAVTIEQLPKLRLLPSCPLSECAIASSSDRLSHISEEEMSTVSLPLGAYYRMESHASLQDSVSDAVAISIPSDDAVIDMT